MGRKPAARNACRCFFTRSATSVFKNMTSVTCNNHNFREGLLQPLIQPKCRSAAESDDDEGCGGMPPAWPARRTLSPRLKCSEIYFASRYTKMPNLVALVAKAYKE